MKKKFFSLVIAFLMIVSLLPVMSVNAEGAALTAISTTVGELSPAFDTATYYYKIELENLDSIPTISATAADGCTAVVEQPTAANHYVSTITVEDESGNTNKYYVRLVPTTGERVIPATAVADKSTDSYNDNYNINEAIDGHPNSVSASSNHPTTGHVADSNWRSANVSKPCFTIDLGKVTDVTKVEFYSNTTNRAKGFDVLKVSIDGNTFNEVTTGVRTTVTDITNDLYGMGYYPSQWTFATPVEARYLQLSTSSTLKVQLYIYRTTVYARTFDEPELASLTVDNNTHTLSPAFAPDVYDYTVMVDDLANLPILSATAPEGYTAEVTQMAEADNYSDNYVARVKVNSKEVPADERTYTIRALSTQHDAMLPITYQERGCGALAGSDSNTNYSMQGGVDLSAPSTIYYSISGRNPYYTVDLGNLASVSEVRFNQRSNLSGKASTLGDTNVASAAAFEKLEISSDGINFVDVTNMATKSFPQSSSDPIGSDNIYKLPYYQISFKFDENIDARYIRVSNDDAKTLYIRGTEVFGKLLDDGVTNSLDKASGKASATYKVQDGHENARIILALYKIVEDGVDNTPDATLEYVDAKVSAVASDGKVSVEYDIPDGKADKYVVKAFVLDSLGTLVPIALSRGI